MSEYVIAKIDADKQQVFGMANVAVNSESEIIKDFHNDLIDPQELEKAAYDFVLEFRDNGVMHEGESTGRLIESYLATPQKMQGLLKSLGVKEDLIAKVQESCGMGWWIGFQIDDPIVFKRVKTGELKMFSIQGKAKREVVGA